MSDDDKNQTNDSTIIITAGYPWQSPAPAGQTRMIHNAGTQTYNHHYPWHDRKPAAGDAPQP